MTEGPRRTDRPVPSARRIVLALAALSAVLWVVAGHSYVVLGSPSMEPWASPGDLLLHRSVPAAAIAVDDVITISNREGDLLTQRVVEASEPADGAVIVRLQGDASPLPDPVPVPLDGEVDRVRLVIPLLGAVLRSWGSLLWTGLVLILAGVAALWVQRRLPQPEPTLELPQLQLEPTGDVTLVVAAVARTLDPRLEALLATCEQLAEDGLAQEVVADLVRVRACELLGLPSAERSGAVLSLDDGGRFYVVALADADPDALAVVPADSVRRRTASAALDRWWTAVSTAVPADVRAAVTPLLPRSALFPSPSDDPIASRTSDNQVASPTSDDPIASPTSDDARPPGAGVVVGRAEARPVAAAGPPTGDN